MTQIRSRHARRTPLLLALILLPLASPALAGELSTRESRALIGEAKSVLVAGDAERASELTTRVLSDGTLRRAARVEALLTACAAAFNEGRHRTAFAYCDLAERVGGPSWRVHGLRGMAYLARGDADAAVASFRAGLRENRRSPTLRRGLRRALRS